MNEHQRPGDPAYDRLVAADPAKRAPDPVEGVLRAKVDALIAGSGSGPLAEVRASSERAGHEGTDGRDHSGETEQTEQTEHEQTEPGSGRTDELALRRHRRRTPWLVAAAVAGIIAAGGGGYLAGESGAGIAPTAADSAVSAPESGSRADAAPESEAEAGAGTESDVAPSPLVERDEPKSEGVEPLDAGGDLPSATGLVFHAGVGLSNAPTTAEVYTAGASASESLGSYPVVSEVEAVERLGDPRFSGAVLGSRPQVEASPGDAPTPGGSIAWPVEDVTIVSATLTEARYALPDGVVLLVPAYDLKDATGSGWTVMAVDEELLDFAP